jgi:hypothetical protein
MTTEQLPYGRDDLDAEVHFELGPPKRIRCFIKGCQHLLRPPTRAGGGDVCPDHGIRCHSSGTYSYADVRRNLIVDAELFATRVIEHPFKHETHRFNQENSEDALSWNVFRSLQRAGSLNHVAQMLTGVQTDEEPTLYLWGLRLSDDTFEPWELLIAARERFESKLPVDRPLTEPDIALHLPGKYLILIEAKFTSPNSFYVEGPRQNLVSLTKSELLDIYWDDAINSLDRVKALTADRVHYQLWRNLIFAEWMASRDARTTKPYLASLTRVGYESESCAEFHNLLAADQKSRFRHVNWEQIAKQAIATQVNPNLVAYLSKKTARLRPAFCDWNTLSRT